MFRIVIGSVYEKSFFNHYKYNNLLLIFANSFITTTTNDQDFLHQHRH